MGDTVVIGVGNRMRGDDAAGLVVIDRLTGRLAAGVRLVESAGDVTHLLDAWRDASRAVVIDAVVSGDEPGTVHRLDARSGIPSSWRSPSSHLLGLVEALELGAVLDAVPADTVVFGIEAAEIDTGSEMTGPVEAATLRVADEVLELLGAADA
jgi:hydrogenase maturation protease